MARIEVETVTVVLSDEDGASTEVEMGAYTTTAAQLINLVTLHMRTYIELSPETRISLSDFTLYLMAQAALEHERNGGILETEGNGNG